MFNIGNVVTILDNDSFYFGKNGIVKGITVIGNVAVYSVVVNGNITVPVREDSLIEVIVA